MPIQEPIQKIMLQLGKTGCYWLVLVRAAEMATSHYIDPLIAYMECVKRGWVDAECYLNDPDMIIGYLLGGKWTVRKETPDYKPVLGDIVVLRYEKKNTMSTDGHFVLGGLDKSIVYDPMGASETVLHGELKSLRILSRSKI